MDSDTDRSSAVLKGANLVANGGTLTGALTDSLKGGLMGPLGGTLKGSLA